VTVNKCPVRNVTAPEHNNQFGVYKKFIFCKVTVNKQQHRYIGIHQKAIIIRVVNGLAFSMVTVFEDFSLNYYFMHLLFSCYIMPLFLLLIPPSVLTLSVLCS